MSVYIQFCIGQLGLCILIEKNNTNHKCFNVENYVISFLMIFVVYISWITLQKLI